MNNNIPHKFVVYEASNVEYNAHLETIVRSSRQDRCKKCKSYFLILIRFYIGLSLLTQFF